MPEEGPPFSHITSTNDNKKTLYKVPGASRVAEEKQKPNEMKIGIRNALLRCCCWGWSLNIRIVTLGNGVLFSRRE